jgi:hypothetical protein
MALPTQPATRTDITTSREMLLSAWLQGTACAALYKAESGSGGGAGVAVVAIVTPAGDGARQAASRVGPVGGAGGRAGVPEGMFSITLPAVAVDPAAGAGTVLAGYATTLAAGDALVVPGDRVNRPETAEVTVYVSTAGVRVGGHWTAMGKV